MPDKAGKKGKKIAARQHEREKLIVKETIELLFDADTFAKELTLARNAPCASEPVSWVIAGNANLSG